MMKAVFPSLFFIGCFISGILHADDSRSSKGWSAIREAVEKTKSDVASPIDIAPLSDKVHFKNRIVRFGVRVGGYPIFFRSGAAEIDEQGRIKRAVIPTQNLVAPSAPIFFPTDDQIATWMKNRGEEAEPPFVPGYYVDEDEHLVPSIRVETASSDPDAQVWFLHAATGRILFSEPKFQAESQLPNLIESNSTVRSAGSNNLNSIYGAIYPENPHVTPDVTVTRLDYLDEDAVHLYGRYARVETCVDTEECKETAPIASRSDVTGSEFVFEPTSDLTAEDPFAEVNTYYNLTTQSNWMRERFGWDDLFLGETWITVKVGKYWENAAYYAGSDKKAPYIVFGRTENFNFAYDSDTARHEFGHAINDTFWDHPWSNTDAFGLDTTMTAIEESIADMWALSFADDPLLNGFPGFSRNADNALTCPKNTLGEGHYDARYVDGFLWDLREMIGKDAFEFTLYGSLAFLTNASGYNEFVSALEQSAEALIEEGAPFMEYSHIDAIRDTARDRGLLDEKCQARLVPFEDGQTRYSIGYGRPRTKKMDYPFALQWEIAFPRGKTSADLNFTWLYPETNDEGEAVEPGFRVHVRRGAPVEVIWLPEEERKEGEAAFDVIADATFDHSPEKISFPYSGLSPATEGEKIYVLLSGASEESDLLIQADLHLTTNDEPLSLPEETETDESDANSEDTAAAYGASCQMSPSRGASRPINLPTLLLSL